MNLSFIECLTKLTLFICLLFLEKATSCGRPLGLASGNIYDYQLDASSGDAQGSDVESMALAHRGRLYNPNPGWCSNLMDQSPWFLVGFILMLTLELSDKSKTK